MNKSKPFSIFLLRKGVDAKKALKDDHSLEGPIAGTLLPKGATLFVLDNQPYRPWWRDYFGIKKEITQVSKGALVFLPVKERCFALSFGNAYHELEDTSYEYDFGLRVTLNSVDPNELKSTDTLDPGAARRQRTQVPVGSDLTYFDFDQDSAILKTLTGKVKDDYKHLFKNATGATNLHISTPATPDELVELCEELLALYDSDEFKKTFPDIQSVEPVRDPTVVAKLNDKLIDGLHAKDETLALAVPDLLNYQDDMFASFAGAGASNLYEDVSIEQYYEYLESNGQNVNEIDLPMLRRHSIRLTDADGRPHHGQSYSILKSLIYATELDSEAVTYHLSEGTWYRVEDEYNKELRTYLDARCIDVALPPYNHDSEGAYNKAVAKNDEDFICLDLANISPTGKVEPCDLYSVEDKHGLFHHIKVSTRSSQLSHLFNQGSVAIELLKGEPKAVTKLKALIKKQTNDDAFFKPIDRLQFRVRYGIVTRKPKAKKSGNLPIFSRISLRRNLKALHLYGADPKFGFIEDQSPQAPGKKKPRKKKNTDSNAA